MSEIQILDEIIKRLYDANPCIEYNEYNKLIAEYSDFKAWNAVYPKLNSVFTEPSKNGLAVCLKETWRQKLFQFDGSYLKLHKRENHWFKKFQENHTVAWYIIGAIIIVFLLGLLIEIASHYLFKP